jgi:ubiquinone/menaquinone biosynthesis C-methylase UbiE
MASKYNTDNAEKYFKETLLDKLTLKPMLYEAIGDVKGKIVLDMGCGSGRHSIYMAKNGAKVTAIDASESQIKIANERNSHSNILYHVGDCSRMKEHDASFDLVLMNMVVTDMSNKEKLIQVLSEASRVLKRGGKLIITTLHPFFVIPDSSIDSALSFDRKRYFDEGHNYSSEAFLDGGGKFNFSETHFSLSFLSKAIRNSELLIEQIMESRQEPNHKVYLPKFILLITLKP